MFKFNFKIIFTNTLGMSKYFLFSEENLHIIR